MLPVQASPVRIKVRQLILVFAAAIGIPLLLGGLFEFFFDTDLFLIFAAAILSIPIAVVSVCRTALAEMERVVQAVAPTDESQEHEQTGEGSFRLSQLQD